MSFTRPFVTKHFIDYEQGVSYVREVSVAFRPIDQFTREQPLAPLSVSIKELPGTRAGRNYSGFFFFEDLEPGNYTLMVKPNPVSSDYFYLEPFPGDPWASGFELPIEIQPNVLLTFTLRLVPKVSYPFPANATLIRGRVTQGSSAGVADAVVTCTYDQVDPQDVSQTIPETVETLTNGDGEYVLFFKSLPDVTQLVTVTAEKGASQAQDQVLITEGKTALADPLDLP